MRCGRNVSMRFLHCHSLVVSFAGGSLSNILQAVLFRFSCLSLSHTTIPTQVATFSEFFMPYVGKHTIPSHSRKTWTSTPINSLPKTYAIELLPASSCIFVSQYLVAFLVVSTPITLYPIAFRSSTVFSVLVEASSSPRDTYSAAPKAVLSLQRYASNGKLQASKRNNHVCLGNLSILHFWMRWARCHATQADRLNLCCFCQPKNVSHIASTTDVVKYDSYRMLVIVTLMSYPINAIAVNVYQPALLVRFMLSLQE